ncbi:NADPH:quinone oxidoreductase family protein [Kineosporia sp. NBRC 101731]|uniref:NADPH:quinone oxidoreductase family protein n=1 Tax=Kineosporia sp. NBRC 101731 TaxID=3032199 RepID=UPI0024A12198|nr:NADPH:quinone oxidoreductase family protein [Kineosporia sp. NBRC 101731]GLY29166.1 NADPH:quinone oxidoreductase [Kineosporia sp. NBRC 101731]
MRAVRVTSTGGPEALEIGEVPEPVAGPGEVLIDVEAAGVNFPDVLLSRDLYQHKPGIPFVLGGEVAGTVREASPDSGFVAGDRVAAATVTGAFAQTVAVPVGMVGPLPGKTGFVTGACLPMNYLTMSFALNTRAGVLPGQTVLVHGAAGGIGTATVQLAKALGARVISVVSTPEKAEFVKELGSDEVVLADGFKDAVLSYTAGAGVDVVVDPVGGDRFTDSLRCLAPLGRLLVVGFTEGSIPTVKVNRLLLNNIDVRGVGWGAFTTKYPQAWRREWDRLMPLLKSGVLEPPVHRIYSLERAAEAIGLLEERAVFGKVVIQP